MKNKIILAGAFTAIMYFLPLMNSSELLPHFKIWVLTVCSIWILLKNPELKWTEVKANAPKDQYTAIYIMAAGALTQIMAVIEWSSSEVVCNVNRNIPSIIGLFMLFGGLGLRIWAYDILNIRKFFTATVRINSGWKLIRIGPFKCLRHPSYTGAFITMIGTSVFLETYISLFISVVLMLIIYYKRITLEEAMLRNHFGKLYIKYSEKTWAFIPFIW
jgi:protein-S-isoprenylcysteine O-methyltransferase Ste14